MNHPYVTTRILDQLDRSLSVRDQLVLATLARVRLASSGQLERLCFIGLSRRRARQALARMVDRRLIARLPRTIGGTRAGSGRFVYSLDVAGRRLSNPHDRRRRPWAIGSPFLKHSLAVTELYVRLVEAERADTLTVASFTGEPGCWRTFAGIGGGRVTLKPDAALVIQLGQFEDRWFVEVDRGTESLATLARKCDTYRHYWRSGTEQARNAVFPRVLWLVPDEHRHAQLVDVIGRQPTDAWPLFVVATFDDAVRRIAQGAQV
jgi:hypothetical protein